MENAIYTPGEPITEEWLKQVGFRWHQLNRQPDKHWLLWLGECLGNEMFVSSEDLGIELAPCLGEGDEWFCWLRSDLSHRYSRFLHVRHLKTTGELIRLIEALTGHPWDPRNNLWGSMRTPERAEWIRKENRRLDRALMFQGAKWSEVERDDSRGGALPEHLEAAEEARAAKEKDRG